MREILKVLIIDDTDSDRLSVRRSLRHAGFDVDITEVSDGRTAVETLRQAPFDVAFLDFRLPDGDGLDVLKEARQAGVKTPIIAFTAFGNEDVAVELMKAGATDYLSKNRCSADTVKQCVRRAMALRQLQREKEQALRALVNSEKLTRSVINSLPQFVIVVDRMGNIINVNEACDTRLGSLFGLEEKESLHGRNIEDLPKLAPKSSRKEFASALKSAQSVIKRTRQLVEREISCPPDLMLMMRATPLVRESGGAVILMMDIADQKRREREASHNREVLSTLYDVAADPICSVDPSGKILYANSVFAALTGTTGAGLSGRAMSEVVAPEDHVALAVAMNDVVEKGVAEASLGIKARNETILAEANLGVSRMGGDAVAIDFIFRQK